MIFDYKLLTQSVIGNVGIFTLLFTKPEKEGYLTSLVRFHFGELIFLNADYFIIRGDVEISRKHSMSNERVSLQIRYDFKRITFNEVKLCANGTVRKKNPLRLIETGDVGVKNKLVADALVSLLGTCCRRKENYQHEDTVNTPSK